MKNEIQNTVESYTETALKTLDAREERLRQLATEYTDLTINGLDDKEGYQKVRKARIELKNERTSVENDAYNLRDGANKFAKRVIAREKELVLIIQPSELRLKKIEDDYEALKEQAKIEAERRETERIQGRINALATYNYAIDFYEAKILPEDEFSKLLDHAHQEYQKEQDRIEAEKAEQERLRKEEEERIQRQRAELEQLRAEQQKREAEMRIKQERIAKDQAEREAAIKADQEKIRKEQEAKEAELRAEQQKIDAQRRAIELDEAKKEAAERARIAEIERVKREESERLERERIMKLESERQESLKPDKEKFIFLANQLKNFSLPEFKNESSVVLRSEVKDFLEKLATHIHSKIQNL